MQFFYMLPKNYDYLSQLEEHFIGAFSFWRQEAEDNY